MLAAGPAKSIAATDAELFESLDAVGGEAWRRHRDFLDALPRISGQRRVGRRLEPLRSAEFRLKGDIDIAAKRLTQQPRRLAAMAMIGIANLERPHRHSMEAQQQPLGLEVQRPKLRVDVRPERVDV